MIYLLFIIILLLWSYYFINSKYARKLKELQGYKLYPEIPYGIPGFGHVLYLSDRPHEYFLELSQKLNLKTFMIQLGWKKFIIMNDFNDINASLKLQGDNFAGRWQNVFSSDLAHECGVFFKEKHYWSEQRTFTLRVLRDFGFGKGQTETVVRHQGDKLINYILNNENKEININDQLSVITVNTICDFIMKREYEMDDDDIVHLLQLIRAAAQATDINNLFVNLYPIFESFPKISLKIVEYTSATKIVQIINQIYDYIKIIADEHREKFLPENECTDLIDAFLLEQHKLKDDEQRESTSFIDWQLIRLITELFFAGFETTSSTLSWALLILAKYHDVQQKMYEEIVGVIGNEKQPEMNDKKKLNYVQAVMDEIYRVSSLVPLSVPHRVFETAEVNGYTVEKDSIIITNLYACNRDPKIWKKPWDFYPEHFLNDEGKYVPRVELIPFGTGKRQCLGESLARVVYFIMLVKLIQRFDISMANGFDNKSIFELFRGTNGIIRGPIDYKISFKSRI